MRQLIKRTKTIMLLWALIFSSISLIIYLLTISINHNPDSHEPEPSPYLQKLNDVLKTSTLSNETKTTLKKFIALPDYSQILSKIHKVEYDGQNQESPYSNEIGKILIQLFDNQLSHKKTGVNHKALVLKYFLLEQGQTRLLFLALEEVESKNRISEITLQLE